MRKAENVNKRSGGPVSPLYPSPRLSVFPMRHGRTRQDHDASAGAPFGTGTRSRRPEGEIVRRNGIERLWEDRREHPAWELASDPRTGRAVPPAPTGDMLLPDTWSRVAVVMGTRKAGAPTPALPPAPARSDEMSSF